MPLLAALYDLVQNALDFAVVEARLAPVLTSPQPTTDAVEIGRALTRDLPLTMPDRALTFPVC